MLVTVAICTWNRQGILGQCLAGFEALRVPPGIDWELIVVDNASTDGTADLLSTFQTRLPLRREFEPAPGKSRAANRAVTAARGSLTLWTDDDVLVDPGWLEAYVGAAENAPDFAYFGGPVIPWFEVPPPAWVLRNIDALAEPYALANHGAADRPVIEEAIVGANMGFRTAVIRDFPFNEQIGPSGSAALRGEETELLGRLRAAGHRGYWVGGAVVRHHISAARLTYRYLAHWYSGLGAGLARREQAFDGPRILGYPRWATVPYLRAEAEVLVRSLRRDAGWVNAVRKAGLLRGYLVESKARRP